MVLALKAVTAVSLAPFMNNDVSVGVNALLLPFEPEPKMPMTLGTLVGLATVLLPRSVPV